MNRILSSLICAAALTSPSLAQCQQGFNANWGAPLVGVQESGDTLRRAVQFTNTHPHEIKICNVAMRLSHNMNLYFGGNATVFYTLVQAQQLGPATLPTGPILAFSQVRTIPSSTQVIRESFLIDPVLQPGQTVFLVANYSIPGYYLGAGNIMRIRTSGTTDVPTWWFGRIGAFDPQIWHYTGMEPMAFDVDARFTVNGSSTSIGGGCGNTQLNAGTPRLGLAWNATVTGGSPLSLAMIAVGSNNPNADLASLGAPGCTLKSSLESIMFGVSNAAGSYTRQVAIANDPALLGATFYSQGAAFEPSANALGLALTNGRELVIGDF